MIKYWETPINAQSESIQFYMKQLSSFQQVNSLFICDIDQMNTVPTQESCLIALANKQYLDASHLCNISISRPNELIYQLQSDKTQPNINLKYISASEIIGADYPSPPEYHS
jgi:hypothetical protein